MYNEQVEKELKKLLSEPKHDFNLENVSRLTNVLQLMDEYNPKQDRMIATTFRHSYRVAEIAAELGKRMGLDEKSQIELVCAGLLHDIGKTVVPKEILYKPGRLTDEEYKKMSLHDKASAGILNKYFKNVPAEVMQAVKHHHSGNVDNELGRKVSERAEQFIGIMRASDQFEALESNDRTYNKAPRTVQESYATLKENAKIKNKKISPEYLGAMGKLAVEVDRDGRFDEYGNVALNTMPSSIKESLIAEAAKANYTPDIILDSKEKISYTENSHNEKIEHIQNRGRDGIRDKKEADKKGVYMAGSFRIHGPNHIAKEELSQFNTNIYQFCAIERAVKDIAENKSYSDGKRMSLELHFPLTSNLDITVVAKDGDYDIGVYDSAKEEYRRDISNIEYEPILVKEEKVLNKINSEKNYALNIEKNTKCAPVYNEERYHRLHDIKDNKIRNMPYKKEYDNLFSR